MVGGNHRSTSQKCAPTEWPISTRHPRPPALQLLAKLFSGIPVMASDPMAISPLTSFKTSDFGLAEGEGKAADQVFCAVAVFSIAVLLPCLPAAPASLDRWQQQLESS